MDLGQRRHAYLVLVESFCRCGLCATCLTEAINGLKTARILGKIDLWSVIMGRPRTPNPPDLKFESVSVWGEMKNAIPIRGERSVQFSQVSLGIQQICARCGFYGFQFKSFGQAWGLKSMSFLKYQPNGNGLLPGTA